MVQNKVENGLPALPNVDLCKKQKVALWFQADSSTFTGISNRKCIDFPMGFNIEPDEVIKLTSLTGLKCTCRLRRVVVWKETNQKNSLLSVTI